jgi:hypothetical protein
MAALRALDGRRGELVSRWKDIGPPLPDIQLQVITAAPRRPQQIWPCTSRRESILKRWRLGPG